MGVARIELRDHPEQLSDIGVVALDPEDMHAAGGRRRDVVSPVQPLEVELELEPGHDPGRHVAAGGRVLAEEHVLWESS